MSFIIYDRLAISASRQAYNLSFYRRFDKIWGKINSSHYIERFYIYYNGFPMFSEDDSDFTKFLACIGLSYDDVLGPDALSSYSDAEIQNFYFKLVEPVVQTADDKFEYTEALKYIPTFMKDQIFEVEFHYGGDACGFYLTDDLSETIIIDTTNTLDPIYGSTPALTPIDVRDRVMSMPGKYLLGTQPTRPQNSRGSIVIVNNEPFKEHYYYPDTFKTISNKIDYPYKPIIECAYSIPNSYYWYALFDDNHINFEIVSMTEPTKLTSHDDPSRYGLKWRVQYKIIAPLDEHSDCLVSFIDQFNSFWFTNRNTGPEPIAMTQADYAQSYPMSKYPDLWENGLLKVDAVVNMKKADFPTLIAESFTTDYDIYEPSWWEKLLGFVVIIAGVVVGVILCCTGTGNIVIGIGTGLMSAAITWSVGAIALGAIGGPSTYQMVKNIAGVAQIASIAGGVMLLAGKIAAGFEAFKKYLSTLYDDFLKIFTFDTKPNVDPNIVIESVDKLTDVELDDVLFEALENEIDLKDIFLNPKDLTSERVRDSLIRYQQQKLLNSKLVKGVFDLGTRVYQNYNKNIYEQRNEELQELKDELQELNEENSPSNFHEVLGDKIFTYSLGSYDALAMLDLKIKKMTGINTINDDPSRAIT